jgi:hypothetical protein
MCKEDGGFLLGEISARGRWATVPARAIFSGPPDTGSAKHCIVHSSAELMNSTVQRHSKLGY